MLKNPITAAIAVLTLIARIIPSRQGIRPSRTQAGPMFARPKQDLTGALRLTRNAGIVHIAYPNHGEVCREWGMASMPARSEAGAVKQAHVAAGAGPILSPL